MSDNNGLIFAVLRSQCELTGPQKLILLALLNHWNPKANGAVVWPSRERIAKQTGFSEKTVYRGLLALQDAGMIKIEHSRGRASNRYVIHNHVIESGLEPVCLDGNPDRESTLTRTLSPPTRTESPVNHVRESAECLIEPLINPLRHSANESEGLKPVHTFLNALTEKTE